MRWAPEPWHTPQDAARRREAWAWACEHGTCGDCAHAVWCPGTDVGVCEIRVDEEDVSCWWVEPGLRAREMGCDYEPAYPYAEEG